MSISKELIRGVKKRMQGIGIDLARYQASSHPVAKRAQQLRDHSIDCVLDVGANTGQYARNLRDLGYRGRIVSFEPMLKAYGTLIKNAASDRNWETLNIALGESSGEMTIKIAENSWSSSLLDVKDSHISAMSSARCVGSETIEVKRLDDVLGGICKPGENIFLKIDTQGFEKQVLEGAQQSLPKIDMLQIEMSFVELYENQALFVEMYELVCKQGFQLTCLEDLWWDQNTGQLMQVDGVFQRA
ncbi:FkbM family methyltransferase [Bythopirellula polymerisocia]|uniref:2-O-methyltransferase NoeI n=1 Tax=Bythopirellula polymerisocia TaxID=2528003 RepID=A0A5C6CU93_9BACT|nr:FkbM family methyltransferase [Bythopirellula polymerisocia]TWU28092.1 2-O-methyltransferase NoeI [Bythopirellula polymerisocia]